jgi:hypothetical protein
VTVYGVSDVGLTVMKEAVDPPGVHEYVPPGAEGVAEMVAVPPEHIVADVTETVVS